MRRLAGDAAAGLLLVLLWAGTYVLAPALLLGWEPVLVSGASMTPLVAPGDVLLLDEPDAGVREGSVITFRPQGAPGLVTHRVVEVLPEGYRTRGDANGIDDPDPVPHARVVGVSRLLVPALGRPAVWLQQGRAVVAVPALALVAVCAVLVLTAPPPPVRPAPRHRAPALVQTGLLTVRVAPPRRLVLAAAAAVTLVALPAAAAAVALAQRAAPATAVLASCPGAAGGSASVSLVRPRVGPVAPSAALPVLAPRPRAELLRRPQVGPPVPRSSYAWTSVGSEAYAGVPSCTSARAPEPAQRLAAPAVLPGLAVAVPRPVGGREPERRPAAGAV